MNNALETRKAQRLLWAVVAGFILLNAVIAYLAFRPGGHSAAEEDKPLATTDVSTPTGTNRP